MAERDEIVAGLKRWAIGSYPEQVAVEFLANTDEPLLKVWVEYSDAWGEDRYWINWETFDRTGAGTLSSGEYATWAIARSLVEGELNQLLWSLAPHRVTALVLAMSRYRENWR